MELLGKIYIEMPGKLDREQLGKYRTAREIIEQLEIQCAKNATNSYLQVDIVCYLSISLQERRNVRI